MAIDKDKLLAAIDAKAQDAYGGDTDSAIARHRASLIEAYLGLNTNPAPEGRSQVVDRSVFETIHTILPSLTRIFAGSSDEVVKFMPQGPEDEAAAEQTTAFVNHVVTQRNQWEQFCSDWIHDALLLGNGYAMVYWDDAAKVERETYEGQTDEQLAVLLQDGAVTVLQHSQRPDEEQNKINAQQYQQAMMQYQQAAQQAQMQDSPMMAPQLPPPPEPPQPAFLHDVVFERRDEDGQLKLCVLPPEHCIIDDDTPDWTLDKCKYFEFRQTKTIADLQAMGLDVPEDISDEYDLDDSPEDLARDRLGEGADFDDDGLGLLREVTVRTIWIESDAEGDEARMYYVIAVGRTILYAEPVSRIHAVSLTPQPLPHRHPGLSVAEMVKDVQDIKTAIKRGGLDNLYLANNGRFAISDKVNLDDFLDSRPGGVVRLTDGALPGEGHVFPLQHPFAFDSIIGSLEYFDQDRQNQGGANRYFSGTDAGAINKTASGTMALQNMSAQRVEHIARMFAPAFENLFSIVHEIISKHQNKAEVIKLRGQWINVDPTAWKTRRDVKISVGVGAGNKDSMLQNLAMTIQMQMALAPAGVATPENIYNALIEQAKLQGFSNPAKFFTDPKQNPPQPQIPPEVQVAQMKVQADQQSKQIEMQADQQKFAAQAHLDQQKMVAEMQKAQQEQEMKLQLEREKAQQDALLEKYKADKQAETAILIKQIEMGANVEAKQAELAVTREIKGAELQNTRDLAEFQANQPKEDDGEDKAQLSQALAMMSQAIEKMSKPKTKTILRDSEGKLLGVKEE